ncbi:putative serine protease 29 [Loxodonta africana]|uniref:putative serine protease 29 n=1 Tax=Loxodonta africana TaxID=9785 RepID=UPI0030D48F3B
MCSGCWVDATSSTSHILWPKDKGPRKLGFLELTLSCLGGTLTQTRAPDPEDGLANIIGSHNATHGRWPWQVSLQAYSCCSASWVHICGGCPIHPRCALTATHCIQRKDANLLAFRVHSGDVYLYGEKMLLNVRRVLIRPNYVRAVLSANLALIQLSASVNTRLVVENALCDQQYHNISQRGWDRKTNQDDMLCATCSNQGRDSCQYDSGGPLVCRAVCSWHLMGVASWSYGCAPSKIPGAYAHIWTYLPWIQQQILRHP